MKPRLTNRCAERVLAHVSARKGVAIADILGPSRLRKHTRPRHHAMRLLFRMGYATNDIGIALDRGGSYVRHVIRGGRA